MPNRLSFSTHTFQQLTALQVYQILALRAEVFVVEQTCPYLDPDGKDLNAIHLLGYSDEEVAAYARILKSPNEKEAIIGRVVVGSLYRGRGFGRELMQQAIAAAGQFYRADQIRISAQCYLQSFYESLGFVVQGEAYLEDDIPHIAMLLNGVRH